MGLLRDTMGSGRSLVLVAAHVEARAIIEALGATDNAAWWRARPLRDDLDLLVTGVGKANAAAATIAAVAGADYACCVNLGVCGAFPSSGLRPGDLLVADRSVLADEGVETSAGFESIAALGFPPWLGDASRGEAAALSALSDARLLGAFADLGEGVGAIATVSTCSGSDRLSGLIQSRTQALGESMEGAAVGLTLANLASTGLASRPVPFIEVRAVSNTTGDRLAQTWDLPAALARLSDLAARL